MMVLAGLKRLSTAAALSGSPRNGRGSRGVETCQRDRSSTFKPKLWTACPPPAIVAGFGAAPPSASGQPLTGLTFWPPHLLPGRRAAPARELRPIADPGFHTHGHAALIWAGAARRPAFVRSGGNRSARVSRRKADVSLPLRTPAYVSRENGAAELGISVQTWDRWVKCSGHCLSARQAFRRRRPGGDGRMSDAKLRGSGHAADQAVSDVPTAEKMRPGARGDAQGNSLSPCGQERAPDSTTSDAYPFNSIAQNGWRRSRACRAKISE